eukprot:SAG31_NODE_3547_length_4135_cov_4.829534_2_plen_43_part_00
MASIYLQELRPIDQLPSYIESIFYPMYAISKDSKTCTFLAQF